MTKKAAKKQDRTSQVVFARDSAEAKAVRVLHDIVGRTHAFFSIFRQRDGSVTFTHPMTVQLTKLAEAKPAADWVVLTYRQAASWEELLRSVFDDRMVRTRLREGSKAPWPWPPSIEGKIYPESEGVPPLTGDDRDALATEGKT